MKLFLESASLDEIKEIGDYGLIDGVITDPQLIAKEVEKGTTTDQVINSIAKIMNGEVHVQIIGREYEDIIAQAMKVYSLGMNMIIKIPATFQGFKAMKYLKEKNVRTSAVSIYNYLQAIMATQNHADYLAIKATQPDSAGNNDGTFALNVNNMIRKYGVTTKVIICNLTSPNEVMNAGISGIEGLSVPYRLMKQLGDHLQTEKDVDQFISTWSSMPEASRTFFIKK
ncbi:MAG: transaldolase family protein [Ferroplasma sp.]